MSVKKNSGQVLTYKDTEEQIFHICCQPIKVQVHINQIVDVREVVLGFTEQI